MSVKMAHSTSSVGLLFSPTASTLLALRKPTANSTRPSPSRVPADASPSLAKPNTLHGQHEARGARK